MDLVFQITYLLKFHIIIPLIHHESEAHSKLSKIYIICL